MKKNRVNFSILFTSFLLLYSIIGLSDFYHHHDELEEHNSHDCIFEKFTSQTVTTTPDTFSECFIELSYETETVTWIEQTAHYSKKENHSQSPRAPPVV